MIDLTLYLFFMEQPADAAAVPDLLIGIELCDQILQSLAHTIRSADIIRCRIDTIGNGHDVHKGFVRCVLLPES